MGIENASWLILLSVVVVIIKHLIVFFALLNQAQIPIIMYSHQVKCNYIFTTLSWQFVNALETIAAHRDESLTGNTSSEKTKKYFIEIEPNAENTQVGGDKESAFTVVQLQFVIYLAHYYSQLVMDG